jgi:hypothetical protein
MDHVYIVMAENHYSGNEHSVWYNERVFATKESALKYIEQKKLNGSDIEYDIVVEEVYA